MIETDLSKVLNYMKQYVENKYLHDSEPMLNYKDLQLVLGEIERLNNIINELEQWLYDNTNYEEYDRVEKDTFNYVIKKIEELRNEEK